MMTKSEIHDRVYACQNDLELEQFIKLRINELEENSKEIYVGQNHSDVFDGFISSKVHFKPGIELGKEKECTDLRYDDYSVYLELVTRLKKQADFYNERYMLSPMFWIIHEYFPADDLFGRYFVYLNGLEKGYVSMKDIQEGRCGFCSERAGLAHNMFKLLGMDSLLISGVRNDEPHAYNIVFPNGYDTEPIILFDSANFISFQDSDNKKYSFAYYIKLTKDEYECLKTGEKVQLNIADSVENHRKMYAHVLSDAVGDNDSPVYKITVPNTLNNNENNIKF